MKKLEILYEDEYLIAVNKPPGLLSVPGRGPKKADCAVARAEAMFGWIREVHRLDQQTSGILLMARTPDVHRKLSAAFAAREVEKTYIAAVKELPADPHLEGVIFHGNEKEEDEWGTVISGRITLYQRLDPENRPHQIIDADKGKEAITFWRELPFSVSDYIEPAEPQAPGGRLLRLELKPLTGRTHQLRLALSTCGAPIPGDTLYAPEEIRASSPRLLLHAAEIVFSHPVSGVKMKIKSLIPF